MKNTWLEAQLLTEFNRNDPEPLQRGGEYQDWLQRWRDFRDDGFAAAGQKVKAERPESNADPQNGSAALLQAAQADLDRVRVSKSHAAETTPKPGLIQELRPALASARPVAIAPEFTKIPKELQAIPRWVAWRYEWKDKRWIKLPIDPKTGKNASVNKPATWADFDTAAAHYLAGGVDGIGFVFNGDGIVGLDFDKCLDPATGELGDAAAEALSKIPAYWEVSPSGRGLHAITHADLKAPHSKSGIEVYGTGRYFTFTGGPFKDQVTLPSGATDLGWFVEKHFGESKSPAPVEHPEANTFWRRVNDAAMKSFDAWVLALFPYAEKSRKGYRISSESLGRALEEDISVHPEGFVDFGVADQGDKRRGKRTAIDLVMEWKPLDTAEDAAMWLCKHMDVEPVALGWKNPGTQVTAKSLDLRISKTGTIADEANVLRILERDPTLVGLIRFDEFKGERLLHRPIPGDERVVGDRDTPRQWRDDDTIALQVYIQTKILPRIGRDKIEAVVDLHARKNCSFHPVRDYLQRLEWDKKPRLDTWLTDYLGAVRQPREYVAAVGSSFLIAAVARIFIPGCQVDSALVVEGIQGIGKSSALRILASDGWFSDSLPADLTHKDARDHLRGKWIIEMPELAQFKRSEIETIKAFMSRRTESYRPSYGCNEVTFHRQCVFAGTTNADEYLVDQTGNRRFWVVACERVEFADLARDRDQLWAEAVSRYMNREPWHLSQELTNVAAKEADARVAHDPWTARVVEALEHCVEVSPGEVLGMMGLPIEEKHARNAARVGQILRDLGWRKGQRHMTRGQLYFADLA